MKRLVIQSLPQAFEIIKEMDFSPGHGESDYRQAGRQALGGILEERMNDRIDRHLEDMAQRGEADRRNGSFSRHLVTELGDKYLNFAQEYKKCL